MHTKDRMARLQMEATLAVLGDDRRYPTDELLTDPLWNVSLVALY